MILFVALPCASQSDESESGDYDRNDYYHIVKRGFGDTGEEIGDDG
ncbi:unnamed protein product, partial [Onchocerca ochengi]|uniref:Bravo_FIGEY domain-containing protein n=1 Tax=Onchocerca ochengi TaxID=42157 RepID=A0A182EYD7_ONCOC